jgi:predicted nucleotidyltransferase
MPDRSAAAEAQDLTLQVVADSERRRPRRSAWRALGGRWRVAAAWAMICLRETPVGLDELIARRDELLRVARAHGAVKIRVFGSAARGTAGPESDVDFLVELEPGRTLLDLVALAREWGAVLGRRADVTTPAALHPLLADRILAEARPL